MITILDFYADWCKPCKQLAPILEEIVNENSEIILRKIDVEQEQDLADEFGIRNIPTLLFMKNNKVLDKIVGNTTKIKLLETINKYL